MSNNLDNNVIPCEYCQELININDYLNHERVCKINYNIRNLGFNYVNILNNNHNYSNQLEENINLNNTINILFSNFQNNNSNSEINNNNSEINNNNSEINNNNSEINNNNSEINNIQNNQNLNIIFPNSNNLFQILFNNLSLPDNYSMFIDSQENEDLFDISERIGNVEKGIDDINTVSSLLQDLKNEEKIWCAICQDYSQSKIRKTMCQHFFCDECISLWLRKSKKCPCCLIDLEDKYLSILEKK